MNINHVSQIANTAKLNKQNSNQSESFIKQFRTGQLLSVKVLEVYDDFVFLDIQGNVVRAKNQADKPLTPNQNIVIRVDAQLDDMLLVKIESDEVLAKQQSQDNALLTQLQRLGFSKKNDSLLNVLRALHEQQLPPTRQAVTLLRSEIVGFQQIVKQLTQNDNDATIDWTKSIKQQAIALNKQAVNMGQLTQLEDKTSALEDKAVVSTNQQLEQLADNQSTNLQKLRPESKDGTMLQTNTVEAAVNADNQSANRLEIVHLKSILTEQLATIADKSEPQLANLFAAMEKFSVEKTPLNTVLFNQFLTGKLDAFSEILDAIQPARDMMPKQLVQLLDDYDAKVLNYEEFAEKLDGKAIKELTELAKAIQRELVDLKLVSESEHRTEQLAVAQRSVSLINDQINWQAIQIPVQLKQELRDAEIYIASNHKKGSKFNSDDGLVYIALNTKKLATVRVKLNFKKDSLNIHFVTENDNYSSHIKRFEEILLTALEAHIDRHLTVTYSTEQADFNLAEMVKQEPVQLAAFDHKV